jgi:hypothetical protein
MIIFQTGHFRLDYPISWQVFMVFPVFPTAMPGQCQDRMKNIVTGRGMANSRFINPKIIKILALEDL